MRSRYTAFVVGDVEHLLRSWHPATRPDELDLDPDVQWPPARRPGDGPRQPLRRHRLRRVRGALPAGRPARGPARGLAVLPRRGPMGVRRAGGKPSRVMRRSSCTVGDRQERTAKPSRGSPVKLTWLKDVATDPGPSVSVYVDATPGPGDGRARHRPALAGGPIGARRSGRPGTGARRPRRRRDRTDGVGSADTSAARSSPPRPGCSSTSSWPRRRSGTRPRRTRRAPHAARPLHGRRRPLRARRARPRGRRRHRGPHGRGRGTRAADRGGRTRPAAQGVRRQPRRAPVPADRPGLLGPQRRRRRQRPRRPRPPRAARRRPRHRRPQGHGVAEGQGTGRPGVVDVRGQGRWPCRRHPREGLRGNVAAALDVVRARRRQAVVDEFAQERGRQGRAVEGLDPVVSALRAGRCGRCCWSTTRRPPTGCGRAPARSKSPPPRGPRRPRRGRRRPGACATRPSCAPSRPPTPRSSSSAPEEDGEETLLSMTDGIGALLRYAV